MIDTPLNSRFAALDIGSHTIRLLIVEVEDKTKIVPLTLERRITRLSRSFSQSETLMEESIHESIAVLGEFASLLHGKLVGSVCSRATGVVRRARNAGDFLRRIHEATGIDTALLSEQAEAFLSARGMLSGLPQAERFVAAFDLGGSSTELVLMDTGSGKLLWSTSIFIGAATLTERFLPGDPPDEASVIHASEAIQDALCRDLSQLRGLLKDLDVPPAALQLVGTAGTVTTLAAMFLKMDTYEPSRVNGLIITEEWLSQVIDNLASMSLIERQEIAGLEAGRESIILGGALIVRELLRGLERKQSTVVDSGLLEGMVLALIEKAYGWPSGLSSSLTFGLQEG